MKKQNCIVTIVYMDVIINKSTIKMKIHSQMVSKVVVME
ncbi:hypothetical protein BN189_3340001 [Clostridioides difficile T10]|nr:hypothetical protein QCA_2967 [Clostridioides difficile CD40]CCL77139.1 hypothetical protein BN186_1720001 [Clostridioides difficile E23]CCL88629.1 hypothetical protein BN189_3340001 [Clostridioides difficile T10]